MKLSRRLLLLIVLCLLPMVAAGIATLAGLYAQRRGELDTLATRQAELANADVRGVVDGARTLLLAVAQIQEGPGCPERFASLQRDLSSYRFLMLLDSGGRVICASPSGLGRTGGRPTRLADPTARQPCSRLGCRGRDQRGYLCHPSDAAGCFPAARDPAARLRGGRSAADRRPGPALASAAPQQNEGIRRPARREQRARRDRPGWRGPRPGTRPRSLGGLPPRPRRDGPGQGSGLRRRDRVCLR